MGPCGSGHLATYIEESWPERGSYIPHDKRDCETLFLFGPRPGQRYGANRWAPRGPPHHVVVVVWPQRRQPIQPFRTCSESIGASGETRRHPGAPSGVSVPPYDLPPRHGVTKTSSPFDRPPVSPYHGVTEARS